MKSDCVFIVVTVVKVTEDVMTVLNINNVKAHGVKLT